MEALAVFVHCPIPTVTITVDDIAAQALDELYTLARGVVIANTSISSSSCSGSSAPSASLDGHAAGVVGGGDDEGDSTLLLSRPQQQELRLSQQLPQPPFSFSPSAEPLLLDVLSFIAAAASDARPVVRLHAIERLTFAVQLLRPSAVPIAQWVRLFDIILIPTLAAVEAVTIMGSAGPPVAAAASTRNGSAGGGGVFEHHGGGGGRKGSAPLAASVTGARGSSSGGGVMVLSSASLSIVSGAHREMEPRVAALVDRVMSHAMAAARSSSSESSSGGGGGGGGAFGRLARSSSGSITGRGSGGSCSHAEHQVERTASAAISASPKTQQQQQPPASPDMALHHQYVPGGSSGVMMTPAVNSTTSGAATSTSTFVSAPPLWTPAARSSPSPPPSASKPAATQPAADAAAVAPTSLVMGGSSSSSSVLSTMLHGSSSTGTTTHIRCERTLAVALSSVVKLFLHALPALKPLHSTHGDGDNSSSSSGVVRVWRSLLWHSDVAYSAALGARPPVPSLVEAIEECWRNVILIVGIEIPPPPVPSPSDEGGAASAAGLSAIIWSAARESRVAGFVIGQLNAAAVATGAGTYATRS